MVSNRPPEFVHHSPDQSLVQASPSVTNTYAPELDDFLDIDLWGALRKHWITAVGTTIVTVISIGLYTVSQSPIYRSSTLILLDNQTPNPLVGIPEDSLGVEKLSTEIRILQSSPLISKAIEQLKTTHLDLSLQRVIRNLSVSQVGDSDILQVSYVDTDPYLIQDVLNTLGSIYVEFSLETRKSAATNAIQFVEQQLPLSEQSLEASSAALRTFQETYGVIDPLTHAGSVTAARESIRSARIQSQIRVQELQQQQQRLDQQLADLGSPPEQAIQKTVLSQNSGYQQLLTELQSIDIQIAQEQTRFRADSPTLEALQARRQNVLDLLNQQVQSVTGETLTEPGQAQQSASSTVPLLGDSLLEAPTTTVDRLTSAPVASAIRTGAETSNSSSPSLSNVPALRDSVDRISTDSAFTESAADPVPLDPSTVGSEILASAQSLTPEVGSLQQTLASQWLQVQIQLDAETTRLQSLVSVELTLDQQLELIPQLEERYAELTRQNLLNTELVNTFQRQLQELRITEAQEISPWRILEPPALPRTPIAPNTQRNLMLGSMLGLVLGVIFAVLLDKLGAQTITTTGQARSLLPTPQLGQVPYVPKLVICQTTIQSERRQSRQHFHLAESVRAMALNLGYLGSSGQVKVLAFTSALPREGKSTLTYLLGCALAELGHRVLLIDSDMRHPTLHHFIQESNAYGLSTAIATERSWQSMLYTLIPNQLDLLTAGPQPPNPLTLINSEKMSQVLEACREQYSYVLVDTPPLIGLADTHSLAAQVDGTILVVGLGSCEQTSLARATEHLSHPAINWVGTVLNQVHENSAESDYSKYYNQYYNNDSPTLTFHNPDTSVTTSSRSNGHSSPT